MSDLEFKGTKGNWYVERTSAEDGNFQARILSNVGKVFHAGEEKDQIIIIVGEPSKRNGQANIHWEPNANLIAASKDLLEALQSIENDDGHIPTAIWELRNKAIKKALNKQ